MNITRQAFQEKTAKDKTKNQTNQTKTTKKPKPPKSRGKGICGKLKKFFFFLI